jgi:hypothetical protein
VSTYSVGQFLQAAKVQRGDMEGMLAQIDQVKAEHERARAQVQQEYMRAANDLAVALLPELRQEAVDGVVALTGYAPWRQASPLAAARAELQSLSERIAAIEADPRYRDRELLRHATTGSLTRARAELLDMKKPWDEVLARAEHPRLQRLLDVGYGTPQYVIGWWRLSYYQDWEAADQILENFPGKTFPDVAAEVARANETVGTLGAELQRVERDIEVGVGLEHQHRRYTLSRSQLGPRHLAEAQRRITEHVLTSDTQVMGTLLARQPEIVGLYKRAAGLSHKVQYLDAVFDQHVANLQPQLRMGIQKLDKDINKYRRPKNSGARFDSDHFEQRFRDRSERYQKHWARYRKTYQTIYVYDSYDRVDLLTDFLWWDVMTQGRYDGRYVPEVARFYQARPGYQYVPEPGLDADLLGQASAAHLEGQRDAELFTGVDAS